MWWSRRRGERTDAGVRANEGPRVLAIGFTVLSLGCQVRGVIGDNQEDGAAQDGIGSAADDDDGATSGVLPGTAGDLDDTGSPTPTTNELEGGGFVFDVSYPDTPPACVAPQNVTCDPFSEDPWHAMGLGCPGGLEMAGSFSGHPQQLYVLKGGLGVSGYFEPREGERMLIMSTGKASEVPLPREELCPLCPSSVMGTQTYLLLPEPIDIRRVDDELDCTDDPTLIGTGDCSNTLEDQWMAGTGAHDYVEARITATVPEGVEAFSYEFAFFTTEYPVFADHESSWNDIYLAWLESESWTGNVSFDNQGNPVTANGVFLDFRDAPSTSCPPPCNAPELEGFSMETHAGTRWLKTTAPVQEGETFELIFALFDLTDGSFDSVAVLDNFDWACGAEPPLTTPQG